MSLDHSVGQMTSRERFLETMAYGSPDRAPLFEEGIRPEVIEAWRTQGLPADRALSDHFHYDARREIQVDMTTRPALDTLPRTSQELNTFRDRLDPSDPGRYSESWDKLVAHCRTGTDTVMLNVHRGFFLTMGVHSWRRFMEVMDLIIDHPQQIREIMRIQGEFAARLADRILGEIKVDAAIFSEPIGGNDKPLISPAMYEDFVLKSYEPTLKVLRKHKVKTVIFRTYANGRVLIPSILKWGLNCLWACEASVDAMDYGPIRREYGKDLRLIGGIDLDLLRHSKKTIKATLEDLVPSLVAGGGYVPLADGRVREDVPFENYVYYRKILGEITGA